MGKQLNVQPLADGGIRIAAALAPEEIRQGAYVRTLSVEDTAVLITELVEAMAKVSKTS